MIPATPSPLRGLTSRSPGRGIRDSAWVEWDAAGVTRCRADEPAGYLGGTFSPQSMRPLSLQSMMCQTSWFRIFWRLAL